MSGHTKALLIGGSIIIALVVLGVISLMTREAQPETSPYKLVANRVFYYYGEDYFYIVFDLTAEYSGGGKWTIWRSGLKLTTDKNSVIEPDPMPLELKELCGFKNELASSVNVTSYKPVRFQVAYIASPYEKPVKLVYGESGTRVEVPLTSVASTNLSSIVHYRGVNVKVNAPSLVPDTSARLSSDLEWKCYAPGSDFEISVNAYNAGRFFRLHGAHEELVGSWKIPIVISKIEVTGATVVDTEPKLPVILYADNVMAIRIKLRTPKDVIRYFGPLDITLTVEPAEQLRTFPLELAIDRIYDYRSAYSIYWSHSLEFSDKYVIFDLSAKLNIEGRWTIWRDMFRLITDKGNVLEPARIPSELVTWCGFGKELIADIEVSSREPKQFQIAFAIKPGEKPVKLIYDSPNVKIGVPITEGDRIYPVYYHYIDVEKDAMMPFPYFNIITSSSGPAKKCYLAASEFNVSVNVKYLKLFDLWSSPIVITKVNAIGAIVVDIEPKLPVTLSVEEEIVIRIKLRTPEGFSYSGPLTIVLTIEPVQ